MTAEVVLALSIAASGDGWFGADKVKHFLVAAFTQSVTYSVLQASGVSHGRALAGAWAVTAAASVGKELHDRRTTGVFSVRDLVWDAAGAGAATLVIDRSRRGDERPASAPLRAAARSAVGASERGAVERRPVERRPVSP